MTSFATYTILKHERCVKLVKRQGRLCEVKRQRRTTERISSLIREMREQLCTDAEPVASRGDLHAHHLSLSDLE